MSPLARCPRPGTLLVLAAAFGVSGCGLLLDTELGPSGDDAAMDSGIQPPVDAQVGDAVVGDAVVGDAVVGDAVVGDSGPRTVEPLPPCGAPPDPATIALYRMEDLTEGRLFDATGAHPGAIHETVATRPGPPGCGTALDTTAGAYAVVDHHEAFKLGRGAVDLWIYFEDLAGAATSCSAFLSRDAQYQAMGGHLTFYLNDERRLGLRLQTDEFLVGGLAVFTEAAYATGTWHHVGMNFGPDGVALFVDGLAEGRGSPGSCTDVGTVCTVDCTTSIEGNANPWVVGAGATESAEGSAHPVNLPFYGAIDELRISSTHRDFVGAGA